MTFTPQNMVFTYLKERMIHPLETFCLFVPMVSFFLPVDLFLIGLTSSTLLILLNVGELKKIVFGHHNYLLYLFCFYMFVLASVNRNVLGQIASGLFFLVVVYVTYLRTKMTRELFEAMMVLCGIGSMFSLYYCTVDFYSTSTFLILDFFAKYIPIPYVYITEIAKNLRSTSTFINSNFYGNISAVMSLIVVYFILQGIRQRKTNPSLSWVKIQFYAVVLIVNLYGLSLTQSRSSVLALLAGLAFLILTFDVRWFIALLIPSVLVIVFRFEPILSLLPRLDSLAGSASTRLEIYRIAMQEIRMNLFFGKGFYTFPMIYAKYTANYNLHAHNLVLEFMLSSGLVGTSLLVARFVSLLNRPIKEWFVKEHEYMPLLLGIIALEIANGYTDVVLLLPQCFILFSLVLMCVEVDHEKNKKA
ncbi:MAG: hypothetical protein A2Y20_08625 [Firmicutes bacterium GWF2_51_9]|nr:MAG: hypothetical protein A2Y20_08625 [Firmicutes bacterium GWF2_51_9]OGS58399.1 MAG: hypothetical protein A2Y19_08685 [Firmicutes bacterium GWE2_51_13]HAM63373.1 hypothetical protein [Erysipelotrichaceae bacterium]HBZ40937.1 hypothetical protein [Erysipelotrichaceae bacterium]